MESRLAVIAGSIAKGKEAVSQVGHPTQIKAQAVSKTSKLPPARTYTEMAERQRALGAACQKVRVWTSPGKGMADGLCARHGPDLALLCMHH